MIENRSCGQAGGSAGGDPTEMPSFLHLGPSRGTQPEGGRHQRQGHLQRRKRVQRPYLLGPTHTLALAPASVTALSAKGDLPAPARLSVSWRMSPWHHWCRLHAAYRLDPTPTKDSHSENCQPAGSWCLPICSPVRVAGWACRDQGRRGGLCQVPLEPQRTDSELVCQCLGSGQKEGLTCAVLGLWLAQEPPWAWPACGSRSPTPHLPPAPSVWFGIFQVSLIRAHKRPEQHGCSSFS